MRRVFLTFAPAILACGLLAGVAQADPDTLPPYDGPGEFQTNRNPETTGCAHRDAYKVISTPIWNLDPNHPEVDYTKSIGTAELWYSKYCQTNWIKTTLPEPATIYEHIYRVGNPNIYTDPQTDNNKTSAFTMQVYAPDDTQVQWQVEIYRNKFKVGWTQGNCSGPGKDCSGM